MMDMLEAYNEDCRRSVSEVTEVETYRVQSCLIFINEISSLYLVIFFLFNKSCELLKKKKRIFIYLLKVHYNIDPSKMFLTSRNSSMSTAVKNSS